MCAGKCPTPTVSCVQAELAPGSRLRVCSSGHSRLYSHRKPEARCRVWGWTVPYTTLLSCWNMQLQGSCWDGKLGNSKELKRQKLNKKIV